MTSHSGTETIDGLTALWARTLGDSRICVAILDGPVDRSHPSLAAANLTLIETLETGAVSQGPASQHGTHVASVIFGQHTGAITGVAPHCQGLIVPIYSDGVDGSIAPCSQLDLARAMTQAVQAGAHIINISGGEFSPSGTAHPLLADAVRNCHANHVLIVAAAGNEGCECLHIPGALPSVLAVGAMDSRGLPLAASNWGERYRTQGILAPGENILGAIPGGRSVTNTGTSFATPIVAGIAALLLCLQLEQGEEPDPHAVRAAMLDSAIACDDQSAFDCRRFLAGRLNVVGAMSQIMGGGGAVSESNEREGSVQPQMSEDTHSELPAVEPVPVVQAASIGNSGPEPQSSPSRPLVVDQQNQSPQPVASGGVYPSACSCGSADGESCSCERGSLVFALGTLGTDFGTEARRDSITQHMGSNDLLTYLGNNQAQAAAIIWTLNLDSTPIYAIMPQGPFASEGYDRLREFLGEQIKDGVERVSIPGVIAGRVGLLSGQVVPVVIPELRCMYNWKTSALMGKPPAKSAADSERKAYAEKTEAVTNFLRRIYDELRNLGFTSQERALNYAAANVANANDIFEAALRRSLELHGIDVVPSPIGPPGSDRWDVSLSFFDPENVLRAKTVYRFTVDVSDVCPVMIGAVRSWAVP